MKISSLHESSMVKSSVYDTESGELIVTFNGDASYKFDAVTEEDYQQFANAESIGRAFNTHIRKYNGSKILTEVADESFDGKQLNENEIN